MQELQTCKAALKAARLQALRLPIIWEEDFKASTTKLFMSFKAKD